MKHAMSFDTTAVSAILNREVTRPEEDVEALLWCVMRLLYGFFPWWGQPGVLDYLLEDKEQFIESNFNEMPTAKKRLLRGAAMAIKYVRTFEPTLDDVPTTCYRAVEDILLSSLPHICPDRKKLDLEHFLEPPSPIEKSKKARCPVHRRIDL